MAGVVEIDDSIDPAPSIEAATSLVDEVCVPAGYGAARLELIERWLAGHFYAVRCKAVAGESAGQGVGEQFQYKLGLILQSTMQGQQALMLDTAGGLAVLSKQMEEGKSLLSVGVAWLGKRECERTLDTYE